jgi:hypothetical protein
MKEKEDKYPYESVKLKKAIVKKVRDNKKATGVPIAAFFELAAEKELKEKNNGTTIHHRLR